MTNSTQAISPNFCAAFAIKTPTVLTELQAKLAAVREIACKDSGYPIDMVIQIRKVIENAK